MGDDPLSGAHDIAQGGKDMGYDAPFAGLKVIDLSQGIAGPYCAMLLAQHRTDVIKVENIGEGDWSRALGVRYGEHTAFSIIGNIGERSIALDLKSEAGKQVLWRLLGGADVFFEGFRPGVIRRLASTMKRWRRASRACSMSRHTIVSGFRHSSCDGWPVGIVHAPLLLKWRAVG